MNILIISTSDTGGGAAIAAFRLMSALKSEGENVKMVVREKRSDNPDVIPVGNRYKNRWNFYHERGMIFLHNRLSRGNLFDISIANRGVSITEMEEYKKADIIHLHWINQGMLSIREIEKILKSGKKVVWTLHDMWSFTGICHHAAGCDHYENGCGHCPYLKTPSHNDLSRNIFRRKESAYHGRKITFVACSNWLKELAKKSPLTLNHHLVSVPNPIDTGIYRPMDRKEIRRKLDLPLDKKIVLFAAVKAADKRKGTDYLVEAARLMAHRSDDLLFLIAGKLGEEVKQQLPLPARSMGYLSPQQMPELYNASDLFITPSLQENLPNTIMEAMSCGTPCLGFSIGGIPEMIDHRLNGYVAEYKNARDLAAGLNWILFKADYEALSIQARKKVLEKYAQEKVIQQYRAIYDAEVDCKIQLHEGEQQNNR